MTEQTLPKDATPLTPLGYYGETLSLLHDACTQTWQLAIRQAIALTDPAEQDQKQEETPTRALVCTLSSMNLRHWQNTSRLLDNLPSWLRQPGMMTGTAMVEWFDRRQNRQPAFKLTEQDPDATPVQQESATEPVVSTLQPDGSFDDLSLIRGIGPKLSQRLNALGINKLQQISGWSVSQAEKIDLQLAGKGRILRENWRGQARELLRNRKAGTV